MKTKTVTKPLAIAVAAGLLAGAPLAEQSLTTLDLDLGASALAAGQGQGQGGAGGHGGQAGQGKGGQGAGGGTGGPQYRGGKADSKSVTTSDEGDDSDKRGPKYMGGDMSNKPGEGDRGGKPVWAQEGLPHVELGRLNVARSPEHVIERQLDEALKNWDPAMESFYELTAEQAATLLANEYDSVLRYDSPLANLALYKELLVDRVTVLSDPEYKVQPASVADLAAILLGSASDKTIPVSEDTVTAINTILGLEMTPAEVSSVADKAEDVRSAIATGHGT